MHMISRVFFAIAVLCLSLTAYAQTPSCGLRQVFFVNGVWNDTPLEALASAAELQRALSEQGLEASQYGIGGTSRYSVRPFWNPGDGTVSDVLEVFLNQRIAGRALADAIGDANLAWTQKLATWLGLNQPGVVFQSYVDELKDQLSAEIAQRRPVVVVAHSQGNILANRAISAVLASNPAARGMISVVGVGVADTAGVGDGYRYVTNSLDLVIGSLPGSLISNFLVRNSTGSNDLSGHKFVGYYLSSGVTGGAFGTNETLRSRVARLTKEAFDRIQCISTSIELQNSVPMRTVIGAPFVFSAKVTSATSVPTRALTGTMRIFGGNGAELCSGEVSVIGLATCSYSFGGSPRLEQVVVKFEGRSGYIDSQATAAVDIKSVSSSFWAGTYELTNCLTPGYIGAGNPCAYALNLLADASGGQYYGPGRLFCSDWKHGGK